ncbi:MAG: two-component system sensor histidine kinase NtrB, partial [Desulfobacteraceae bacterium]
MVIKTNNAHSNSKPGDPQFTGDPGRYINYLEQRLHYLEEVNRFTLDALDMASSLGDFQPSINKLHDIPVILKETRARINRLLRLQASAFFLTNEETKEFDLFDVDPPKFKSLVRAEVDKLIEAGAFAWALREKRAIIVHGGANQCQLLLHVMSTSSRIRGMFVGVLRGEAVDVPDISFALLSIILLNSSNALESFELYRMIREISEGLETRENYRMLFEAAPDGVEVLNARGMVIDCNKTHLVLLGRSRHDIIGSHAAEFFSTPFVEIFRQRFAELQEKGYVESEVELIKGDGSCVPVWRREKAIYDEENRFLGCVVYNRDLTEVKEAEAERSRLEAQLQRAQKMEVLGTLAGGVAHDLNNILGGLVSYPELLLSQIPEDSDLRRPIETIYKSGKRAAAIVQDLLTLGRRGVVLTEVVNLNDIVRDYFNSPEFDKVKMFHPGVEFSMDLDEALMNVTGSPVHLSKVVMNLVSNGAEAIPDGGIVEVSTGNCYLEAPLKG